MPNNRNDRCDSDEERAINRELFTSIRIGDLNRVKSLIERDGVRTNVSDKNNKDNTPLHYATERNKKEIIEELLNPRWKTKINQQNKEGNTPLHIACHGSNKELIQLLLDNKADPGLKNDENKTPLEIARLLNSPDVTEILESYILTSQASTEQLSNLQKCSGTSSEEGESKDGDLKRTSVSQGAINSWAKQVQDKGNELEVSQNRSKEIQQDQCSFLESERRRNLLAQIVQSNSIGVKYLIEEGINVNFEDENGNTSLDIAMKHNEKEIIKILGEKIVHNSFEIINGKSEKCILLHSPKKEENIEEKIRKKVKFSLDALIKLTEEKRDIRKFTHKNVNIFVLFLEAFALQDVEINNKLSIEKKNELIEQYFGKEDNEIIKDIRENFVKRSGKDREDKKIISPLYLQNFVPKTNGKWDVELFFCNLQDYVQGVYDKLSGHKQSELNKKYLRNILQSNSMQKIKGRETVSGLICDLVQEAYSEQPEQQEKVMFDLTVNIIPLFDEELKEGFEELRNLRHNLIHNFYMYRDPNLRLKEFKRAIFDLRSKLFKYYSAQEIHNKLCHARLDEKLDRIIDDFSKTLESLEKKFHQDFLTLSERETTGSFEHVFSELLFSEKDGDVEDLVGKYLRFFAVIDDEKRRRIDNEDENEISGHCRELSDVERREIFEDFVRLEEIKDCDHLYQLKKEDLKEKFGKYGIEECCFNKTIEFSLEGNNAFDRGNVITCIVKSLMSLKISKELAEYKILNQDIISIYDRFIQEEFKGEIFILNNHKDLLRNYYLSENAKQFIERKLRSLIKKEEAINIPSKGIQINIAKVVNNILKTLYNAYHKYQIKFDNIEAAFSDTIFLDFLVSQDVKKLSNLGPRQQGFKFTDMNYIFRVVKKLLKEEYTAPYISKLITKAQSDEVIEEDDLRRLIEILFKKNRFIIYLSELLHVKSEKPNFNFYEVVCEIFEKGDINAKSMQVLLACPKHAGELINVLYKRLDANPNESIESTKNVLNILNDVVLELIYKSNSDKALEILAGKDKNDSFNSPGMMLFKKLVNKGLIEINDSLFIDYQLNIVKAKNAEGQGKTWQNKPEEARKLHEEALKILKAIPVNESPKSLLALSRKAYTHSLLENYEDSYEECLVLYKLVMKIALGSDVDGGCITKEIFNQIKKSVNYEKLLSSSDECKKYLNIISIKKSIAYNEFKQGVRRNQDEAIIFFEKALTTCKEILNLEKTDCREEYKTILPTRRRMINIYLNIGKLRYSLNEYSKALWYYYCALQEETIVSRKERDIIGIWGIGKSMRSILDKLSSIAVTHNKLGEESSHEQAIYHYNNALNIYKKVHTIQKDFLGEEYKGTLKTHKSIAFTLIKLGEESLDKQEALEHFYSAHKIYEDGYEIQKKLRGEEHEVSLKTKINIAYTCTKLGEKLSNKHEALELFYKALTIYDKIYKIQKDLGRDDKDSSKTLNNILKTKNYIAFTYIKLGEEVFNKALEALEHFNKALVVLRELYDIQKEILGEKHSDTLKTEISIAFTFNKLGNESSSKQEALVHFNNALIIYEKIYKIQKDCAKDHENNLRTLNNILRTKNNVAFTHNKLAEESFNKESLKHFNKALVVYKEIYDIQNDLYGKEHADTIKTKFNIAFTYNKLGNRVSCKKKAIEYFINAVNIFGEVYKFQKDLGKDDKKSSETLNNIIRSKNNVAFMHNKLGEESPNEDPLEHFNKALFIYKELYDIQKNLLGEGHEITLKTVERIAYTCNKISLHYKNVDLYEAIVYSQQNLEYLQILKEKKWKDAETHYKKALSFHVSMKGRQTPISSISRRQ